MSKAKQTSEYNEQGNSSLGVVMYDGELQKLTTVWNNEELARNGFKMIANLHDREKTDEIFERLR